MVKRKTQRKKGPEGEYSAFDSLKPIYPNVYLTKQEGFVKRYDLCDDVEYIAIEVKNHAAQTWNSVKKIYLGLCKYLIKDGRPNHKPFVIFRPLRHKPLVMYRDQDGSLIIKEFTNVFGTPYIRRYGKKK